MLVRTFIGIILFVIVSCNAELPDSGCAMRDVMSCVVQLKSYNVPIDTNMMNVVFNVSTEAKLVHVCRAYNNAMPCFQQRLALCANDKQRLRLAEVSRLLLFICAPFSLQRQKTLLKHGKCIKEVLEHPVKPTCPTKNHRFGKKLNLCRDNCESNDVICQMRVHMSELAVCSVIAIEKQCGRQAADFYAYMQTAIIGEEFPIQCKYDYDDNQIRELLTDSSELPTLPNASDHFMVQDLLLPTGKTLSTRPDSGENTSVNNSPLLKKTKLVSSPVLAKKTLQLFLAEQQGLSFSDSAESINLKPQIVRTRNFGRLFRPPKFAEVNVKKPAQNEHTVVVQLLSPEENLRSSNKTLFEANDELPGFLQGARPIPDSSFVRRPIISPKSQVMNRLAPYAEHYADATKKDLTAVKENYTHKMGTKTKATTTTMQNIGTSITTTATSVASQTTMTTSVKTFTSTTIKPTESSTSSTVIPSTSTTTQSTTTTTTPVTTTTTTPITTTTTVMSTPVSSTLTIPTIKIAPTIVTVDPEISFVTSKPVSPTVLKFLPWYYSTFSSKRPDAFVTHRPFQPNTLYTVTQKPYIFYNVPTPPRLPLNFDPQMFAKNFVSSITTTQLPTAFTNGSSKLSQELSSFLDIDHIKQKADSLITSAIDVLKPENGTSKTVTINGNELKKPASDALNGIIKTIEELSPSVIDNIRQKLDNLGHN